MRNFVRYCLRAFFYVMKVRCSIDFDEKQTPKKGVYVSNHVSYLDPIILFAFLPGNPVFALNGHLYRNRLIRFLMRTADVIPFNPIEPGDIKELITKVDSGRLCVIFAEGRITETGGLMKMRTGTGRRRCTASGNWRRPGSAPAPECGISWGPGPVRFSR